MRKRRTRIGYMCSADFLHELEEIINATPGDPTYPMIFPTKKEIQRHRKCVSRYNKEHHDWLCCEIVKVKITEID